MKRLKLDLDEMQVESFDTTPAPGPRGTLIGFEDSAYATNCGTCGTGVYCQGETTVPCMAGTYGGNTCDSTCNQIACTCTNGGPHAGTCDLSCGANDTCDSCFPNGGYTCYDTCAPTCEFC